MNNLTLYEPVDMSVFSDIMRNLPSIIKKLEKDGDRLTKKHGAIATQTKIQNNYKNKVKTSTINDYRYSVGTKEGRVFSKLSCLQGFPRPIRQAIAKDLYYDLDIVNAHPVFARYLCERYSVECPILEAYVTRRNDFLEAFECKKPEVLAVLNGCSPLNPLLVAFEREVNVIHTKFSELFSDKYNRFRPKIDYTADPEFDGYNKLGKFFNKFLVKIESELAEIMVNCCHESANPPVRVGCVIHDGIMIHKQDIDPRPAERGGTCGRPKGERLDQLLKDMENVIFSDYDPTSWLMEWGSTEPVFVRMNVSIKEKEMDEALDMSVYERVEVDPSSVKGSFIDPKEDYFYFNFFTEFNGRVFESEQQMITELFPKLNKVYALLNSPEQKVYKYRDDCYTISTEEKMLFAVCFKDVDGKGNAKKEFVRLNVINLKYSQYLNVYSNVRFDPSQNSPADLLNSWVGFKAKEVDEIDMSLIEPILFHIKQVLCNGNEEHSDYLLRWLAHIVQKPELRTGVMVVLISGQGAGKNIFIDFIKDYVIGPDLSFVGIGFDPVLGRFNGALEGKIFVNLNELSGETKKFNTNFDALKGKITDKTLIFEKKFGNQREEPNYMNAICSTNHFASLKIEQGDRRTFVVECSDEYCIANDFEKSTTYFNALASSLNQETGDHFFTYLHTLGTSISNVPMSSLKAEVIDNCKHNAVEFIEAFKIHQLDRNVDISTQFDSDLLYSKYQEWCLISGHNKVVSRKIFITIIHKAKKIRKQQLSTGPDRGKYVYFLI